MRLGGPLFLKYEAPESWAELVLKSGYRAAYCPLAPGASAADIKGFSEAAAKAGIVIAECGAWSNPLSPDEKIRGEALGKCMASLSLADEIGAKCCVNIAGSRGAKWDGPDKADLTRETFDMIVETVRKIIDSVRPKRSFYCLETMPWMYPDSADSYLELIQAVDRTAFAVHLDPVNLVSSPQRYFANGELIRECFRKLGPYVKSCHAKDIKLAERLTVHLDECRPGAGGLDYRAYLKELAKLAPDTPLMLEHLSGEEEYRLAREHIMAVAAKEGVEI